MVFVVGDHVSHDVDSPNHDDSTEASYQNTKNNLAASNSLIAKYFPNSIVLPNIGNNDGRYHQNAIDEADKSDYNSFVYDLWFNQQPGNAKLAQDTRLQESFLNGAYYRVDLTDTLSVLVLNSMFYAVSNDLSYQANEPTDQIAWMQLQLEQGATMGRKFIITDHLYAGTRYESEEMWHPEWNEQYFKVLRDHADVIVLEIVAHDHYMDLRYHSSDHVLDFPDTPSKFDFHNVLLTPGMTSNKGQQPGVAYFEIGDDNIPRHLQAQFLNLYSTFDNPMPAYEDLEFRSLNLVDYGVDAFDASSLATFRNELELDQEFALRYIVEKLGFDYDDDTERNTAFSLMSSADLITTTKHKTGEYIC